MCSLQHFCYSEKLETSISIGWGMNAKNGSSYEGIFLANKMNELDLHVATLIS